MGSASSLSFSEFQEKFYKRFPSLEVFDSGEVNFVKVILEALKVNYSSRGKISNELHLSHQAYNSKRFTKRTLHFFTGRKVVKPNYDKLKKLAERKFLFVDHSTRLVNGPNGNLVSLYFHRIVEDFGRENVALVNEVFPPHNSDFDLMVGYFSDYVKSLALDVREKKLREEILVFYKRIAPLFSEEELADIGFSLQKFFENFRIWKHILNFLPQKIIVLMCHYHHEGTIYAMKDAGRKVIEMQHGLISEQDIFYCFPKPIIAVRNRAFFPDEIFVYGNYWKNVLLKGFEFSESQIKNVGYYLYESTVVDSPEMKSIKSWIGNRQVILITTQTFLHEHFIRYVKWLDADILKRNLNDVILLKIHPSENPDIYGELKNLKSVKVVSENLNSVFSIAQIHISIYSTTLYEGLRFGLKSFTLDIDASLLGYVNSIVEEGVAVRILPEQNPIDLLNHQQSDKDKKYYFDSFDAQKLLSFLT